MPIIKRLRGGHILENKSEVKHLCRNLIGKSGVTIANMALITELQRNI